MSNENTPQDADNRPAVGGPVERMVRPGSEARQELTAALDKSGSVVLIDGDGEILFYAADGKMKVQRLGQECEGCIAANMKLADAVAQAWNAKLERAADPTNSRPRCGLGA
jgi:Fe-S cluster biogenesis protein NfuA